MNNILLLLFQSFCLILSASKMKYSECLLPSFMQTLQKFHNCIEMYEGKYSLHFVDNLYKSTSGTEVK